MKRMSEVDATEILRALEAGQNTLAYLNSSPVQQLDDIIKNKIHSIAVSCQVVQSRIFNSRSSELDKVWEGLAMLEYMFGKYIKHYNDIDQLGCTICKDIFPRTQDALREHVENGIHIRKFTNIILCDLNEYWKDESAMLKYVKFMDFDGPNDKIFCKVCCVDVEKDKLEVLKHFRENRHQELFKDIVCVITGSKCGNESISNFLFSSSSQKNQFYPGHSSPSSSSQSSPSSTSDSRPATKKSFTRKLVEASLSENVQKAGVQDLKNVATDHRKSTPSNQNNSTKRLVEDNQAMSPIDLKSRPAAKKSFTKKLVDARLSENLQKAGVEDLKNVAASTKSTPSKKNNFTNSLIEDNQVTNSEKRNFVNPKPPPPSSQGLQGSGSSANAFVSNHTPNHHHKKVLFEDIIKMSELQRMHFMVCSINETNLITPIGFEGIPTHILCKDIERACDYLGDVVRVERQNTIRLMRNVIVYVILSDRYKDIFGKGLFIRIGWEAYKVLNPFLYS